MADVPLFGPSPATIGSLASGLEETHISVVFLVGDRAFKLKKPIRLPFLDWRSREARRDMCRREVELNRRIAPDVYLGVADVLGEDGGVCDHLLVMRRMPDERRLSRLVREGADVLGALDDLARVVSAFHASAERTPATIEAASRDAVAGNWKDNLATLHAAEGSVLEAGVVGRVEALVKEYLAGRAPLFEERGAAGHAVDGHGDLLADDIYVLDDGPRVLDCLEFSDRLRAVDVLDDVCCLVMDLERLGAPELASRFLASYQRQSGERHPPSLAHHYIAYRAGVRAKVACVRADQGVAAAAVKARHLLDLTRRHLEIGRVRLVLIGGLPGTGKSTLGRAMAERAGWQLLRSDVVRKELLGFPPSARLATDFGEGIYRPEHTAATYRELLARARDLLVHGESVVVDGSWSDPAWREAAAEVARSTFSHLVEIRCSAPADLAAYRIVARGAHDASDAAPDIAAAMATVAAPWPDATVVDTTGSLDRSLAAALDAVGAIG